MLAPPEKGMTGQIQKNRVNARPNCKTLVFLLQIHFSLHRDTDHMSSFTKPKWLEEARRGSQNKIQGAKGLNFLGWILADDSQKCALQEKSHHRANPQFLIMRQRGLHHREVTMGKCNDFVRARTQVAKSYFMLTINFTPQKGTKEWLEEADTQVSKIKNLGVGRVFFFVLNTCIWSSYWPREKPHHQAKSQLLNMPQCRLSSMDRIWWDKIKKKNGSTRALIRNYAFFCSRHMCPCKWIQIQIWSVSASKKKIHIWRGRGSGVNNAI